MTAPLLEIRNVSKTFRRAGGEHRAVNHVSLSIASNETLALVGESGSGKSTLARLALCLLQPDHSLNSGVFLDGIDLRKLPAGDLRIMRRQMQLVGQDPMASLDPLMTIGRAVIEGLEIHRPVEMPRWGKARRIFLQQRAAELLASVGLSSDIATAYPAQLSGGQRQRVAIARALAVNPRLLVLDEPLASLDIATSAQILNLLVALQQRSQLAYLFITHDLDVAGYLAHRIAVMWRGEIVETGDAQSVLLHPQHDYTRRLLAARLAATTSATAL